MSTKKWDVRFLRIAGEVSQWSKDPGTRVGAVAVRDRRILSTGYNGLPRSLPDVPSRLRDREYKLLRTIHAEQNCIYNATHHGISLDGATMYVYGLPPCSACSLGLVQVGIRRVVWCCPEAKPEWTESFKHSTSLFKETGVDVEELKFVDIYV